MEAPESDDLQQLMPNLQEVVRQQASPANTVALREYIKVLAEKPSNVPAASIAPHKPRTEGLHLRAGTGRRPQRRYFTIKWRAEEEPTQQEQAEQAPLDPEALKDALVEQARAQRRALMEAALRLGTGRVPQCRGFALTLPPLQLEGEGAEMAEEEEYEHLERLAAAQLAAEEAEEGGFGEQLLAADAAHGPPVSDQWAEHRQWAAEVGVLAEQQAHARLRLADAPLLPAGEFSGAATPGTALLGQGQQQDGMLPGSAQQQALSEQRTQLGQARTPGTSLLGRYTPMEGVPERLLLLGTRGKHVPPATVPRFAGGAAASAAAATPAGFTPLEGIPERLHALRQLPGGPRPLGLPGATRIASNGEEAQSVDSPVEGLVQQGTRRRSRGSAGAARPAAGAEADGAGFAGFSPLPQQPAPAGDGSFEAEPSLPGSGGTFPFSAAGPAMPHMAADAAAQTGASLEADEAQTAAVAEAAAAAVGNPDAAALAADDALDDAGFGDDGYDDGGYDDGGYDGGYGDDLEADRQQQQAGVGEDAGLPESSAAAQQRAQRRLTRNPGSRLRNELKRKSLAADPRVGRHELVPGVRRSCRQKQEPLKWWLNEKKEFGRQHKTMPTVNNVVHKLPNTPWQTVTDIKRRPAKKRRAPTPHGLEAVLVAMEQQEAVAEEVEQEQQPDEQHGNAQQQQQQRHWRAAPSRRQQQAGRQRQAGGQQAKQAKAPATKGKATKKKGAGRARRGRR